jgi:carbon monoxide dehydrogenase subunit G
MSSAREDRGSVLRAAGEIEIPADRDVVWDALTDFARWPEWMPGVKAMTTSGPLDVGMTFTWKTGSTIRSQITDMSRPRHIAWKGRTLGIDAVHSWAFEPTSDGTLVRTEETWRGGPARWLRPVMQRMLAKAIRDGLPALEQRVASLT